MIRTILLLADGQCIEGDLELVQQWRETPDSKLWLDIEDEITPQIRALLETFDCSSLAIVDCERTRHPPKVEHFATNSFILYRGITRLDDNLELEAQQIGTWVGVNFVITVHRGSSVSINHFYTTEPDEKLLAAPNILALRLLHFASGRYLEKLLNIEEKINSLEDRLLLRQSEEVMKELVTYRSRLRKLRRIFNYHHLLAENIFSEGSPWLGQDDDESLHIRRDLYDRCERLLSMSTLYYELCGDLVEGYISFSSHQLNNTMKVLTIITAVFVPLSFLAGLYGMNFDNMPELHNEYAYFVVLTVMAVIASSMIFMFKKIRWL